MAPAKRKSPGTSTKRGIEAEFAGRDFVSNEARSTYRGLIRRTVIPERGINCTPPFDGYIKKHGWETFCQTPVDANMTMANEFYANFRDRDAAGNTLCRGKMVQLSPDSINEYYRLRSMPALYKEYKKLSAEVRCDDGELVGPWSEIVREVTQEKFSMDEILPKQRWGSIDKKFLSTEMNVWYGFVATRLLPVTINSEVQWERLRILYALKKNMAINVGLIIFGAMVCMSNSSACIGFHSLITGLCHRAGCEDRIDDSWKQPKGMLTYEAFHRRVHSVAKPPKSATPQVTSDGISLESISSVVHAQGERLARIEQFMRVICENTSALVAQGRSAEIANVLPSTMPSVEGPFNPLDAVVGGLNPREISEIQNDTTGAENDDVEHAAQSTDVIGGGTQSLKDVRNLV